MSQRLVGFPDVFGSKRAGAVAKAGPLGYALGGFEVEAKELGIKSIDFAIAMGSDDGAYSAVARVNAADEDKTSRTSCFVQVFDVTTGAEVAALTNLTGVTFRVLGIG